MSRLVQHDGCLYCDSQECLTGRLCEECIERERTAREGPL